MDQIYTSAQVAKAAGMEPANFRMQFTRKHWRIIGRPADGKGFGHMFSLNDALGFALARELVESGVHPKVAFESAMMDFAHSGTGRLPGGLFPAEKGETWYVFNPQSQQGECIATGSLNDPYEIFYAPSGLTAGVPPRVIVIDLGQLWHRVLRALGVREDRA